MENEGGSLNGDDTDWAFTPKHYLPAVIPVSPPADPPTPRFALRHHLRLVVVALLASGAGVLGAAVWPYHNRLSAVMAPPLPDLREATNSGESANRAHGASTFRLPAASSAGLDSEVCQATFRLPQLVISIPPTLLPSDEPASLGVRADGASDGTQLIVCGFPSKSVFSAGHSLDEKTWALPVSDLAYAALFPPRGFVGPVRLAIVLVNADKSLADRTMLNLQWLPPSAMAKAAAAERDKSDLAEATRRIEEGKRLKAAGNLPMARGIFLRFAQAGDSRAAFLLAETYDPISLARRQLLPPESDTELARIWYRKAFDLGSHEASARLERLENWNW